VAAQEQYVADKEDGLATYYYESGAKQLEILFERGVLVSVQHYDSEAAGGDY
jgi:antitoxin component YwqK of YwqJK toxin-antitoxin module